jgi:hypothetical protein
MRQKITVCSDLILMGWWCIRGRNQSKTKHKGLLSKDVNTMPVCTLLPTVLRPSANWTLRYWSILCTVLTRPLQTTTCLVHSNMLYEAASDQKAKGVVHARLVTQPKTFFYEGTRKCVSHWTKCIENEGDFCKNDALVSSVMHMY